MKQFIIHDKINNKVETFNFVVGMTWREFINSEYNIEKWFAAEPNNDSISYKGHTVYVNNGAGEHPYLDDKIDVNKEYGCVLVGEPI